MILKKILELYTHDLCVNISTAGVIYYIRVMYVLLIQGPFRIERSRHYQPSVCGTCTMKIIHRYYKIKYIQYLIHDTHCPSVLM